MQQYGNVLKALAETAVEGAEPVLRRRADLFAADFEARARAHLAPKCALAAAASAQRHGGVARNSAEDRLTGYMTAVKHARQIMRGGQAAAVTDTSEAMRAGAHAPQPPPPLISCVELPSRSCDEI